MKCPTCNYTSGHTAWCKAGGADKKPDTRDESKRNYKKRDDDGRSKRKG